jgi:hypothetical protein
MKMTYSEWVAYIFGQFYNTLTQLKLEFNKRTNHYAIKNINLKFFTIIF